MFFKMRCYSCNPMQCILKFNLVVRAISKVLTKKLNYILAIILFNIEYIFLQKVLEFKNFLLYIVNVINCITSIPETKQLNLYL